MKNTIEYFLFILFSNFYGLLGLKYSRKFSVLLGLFFYYLLPIRKNTVINNLKFAFPNFSDEKIKKITKENYISFAKSFTEIMYLPFISESKMVKEVECINLDAIKKRNKEGRAIILLTAHFGNWEYMAISTGIQLSTPLNVMIKNQRNPYVTKWLFNNRTKFGNKVFPLGLSIRLIYKKLKDKEIVIMAADQRGDEDGIRVNMFGRSTSVFPGPATLGLKSNAALFCAFPVRQKDNHYKIIFKELSFENLPDGKEEKQIEICQRYLSHLQTLIEENPEQWLWMHKRWKH